MPKGKMATQCSHASVESVMISDKSLVEEWRNEGAKKVVLKVNSEKDLMECFRLAKSMKLKVSLIKDAGKTFFKAPTITCIGIGPDEESKIDKVSGKLKMI